MVPFLLLLTLCGCCVTQSQTVGELSNLIALVNSSLSGDIATLRTDLLSKEDEIQVLSTKIDDTQIALNLLWIVIGASYTIFMQAGFAALESGLAREKNATNVMAQNFVIFTLGFVAFWFFGFAWAFGGFTSPIFGMNEPIGTNGIGKDRAVFMWTGGYAMSKGAYTPAGMAFFLYMAAFMDTTATIPTGSMAERWRWWAFVMWGIYCGFWYYPMFAAWTWGGGWLAQLGNSGNIGFGFVDFAGSGVVHFSGGIAALWGAVVVGPRRGKYTETGDVVVFPPHNVPLAAVGTFILLFGWFGFNAASTFAATDVRFTTAATNTAIAAAFGGFFGVFYIPLRFRGSASADFLAVMNGSLNALAAITGCCAFVAPWAAAVIGTVGAFLCLESAPIIDRKLKIDDPVGAISVHFMGGIWGVLALGLFADGTYGAGWNGTDTDLTRGRGVTGLFYSGNLGGRQFAAQLITILVEFVWMSIWSYGFFKLQDMLFKRCGVKHGIRVDPEFEDCGLDTTEMGCLAYHNDERIPLKAVDPEKLVEMMTTASATTGGNHQDHHQTPFPTPDSPTPPMTHLPLPSPEVGGGMPVVGTELWRDLH